MTMFPTPSRALAGSVAIATTLFATSAFGFATQGKKWSNQAGMAVTYELHPDGSDDIADGSDLQAIRDAFQTWGDVSCSYLDFVEKPWVEPKAVARDNENRIFFVENQGEWTAQAATLALTFTFYNTSDNTIVDADMAVNGVNWRFSTNPNEVGTGTPAKVDLQTVILHEAGHFLGLDHSTDAAAVMYATNNKPVQRTLTLDDVRGVCSLYSNGTPVPNDPNHTGTMPGGPVGAACQATTDCASNRCVNDQAAGRTYCTAQCDLQNPVVCPAGYQCTSTQEGNYCLLPPIVDELCDPCEQGAQCSSGFCTTVTGVNSNRSFCSRPCDPTPGQPSQCPADYSCQPVLGAAGGACAPNTGICAPAGKGGQNEPCYVNGQCKPGFSCVEYYPNSGLNYCYFACASQYAGQSCTQGGGTRCDPVANRENAFVCFSIAYEGQPCIPEICDPTSFCAFDENVGIDSATCYRMCNATTDCGPQSQCQGFPGIPNLCVPLEGFKYEGESCTADAECRSHTCRTYGQLRLCTAPCATTDPNGCGRGFTCVPQVGSTQGLCWPEATVTAPGDTVKPGFCSCDFSSACDPNCACDPECTDGCSCDAVDAPTSTDPTRALLSLGTALALASLVLVRRRHSP